MEGAIKKGILSNTIRRRDWTKVLQKRERVVCNIRLFGAFLKIFLIGNLYSFNTSTLFILDLKKAAVPILTDQKKSTYLGTHTQVRYIYRAQLTDSLERKWES